LERETLALIGVIGAARAQGAEVDIPTIADARDHFDAWLIDGGDEDLSDDTMIKRALGLREG
jgi:hypothetical protein